MAANEMLLYTYINALLSLHQRSVLLHQAGTNTNTTARHYAERERPWSICPTGVVPHQIPLIWAQGIPQKGRQKEYKSRRGWNPKSTKTAKST